MKRIFAKKIVEFLISVFSMKLTNALRNVAIKSNFIGLITFRDLPEVP